VKVVVDATMLDGGPSGAATRLAALGAEHLARGAVDVEYLVRPGTDPLPGLASVPCSGIDTPFRRFHAGARLEALLAERRADVYAAGALPLPRIRSVPVVVTVHDLRFLSADAGQGVLRRAWGVTALRRNLRGVARGVAVSETTSRALLEHRLLESHRVAVVPNAGTPGLERVADVHEIGDFRRRADLTTRYVLAIGPAEPHKRVEDLLEVLAAVRDHAAGADLALVLAGRIDARRAFALARLAESLGVASAFRMVGLLSLHELSVVLSGADALVSAARHEGFAIPVVDAQRLCVPVVAVAAGAVPEVCGDAAWLAEPGDLADLAAAVLGAVSPGDLRDARLRDGAVKAQRWSWSRSAEQLEAVWAAAAATR
jgi:glycosyltransferase involved in cell wall biosynthesis